MLNKAKETSYVTHNHIDGINGSESIALAMYMAKNGYTKEEIKLEIENKYNYDLNDYVITEKFNCLAQITCPNAIIAFLKSNSFEEALINSIKIKGDTDTVACMAGGIAECYYGYDSIPQKYIDFVYNNLPEKYLEIIKKIYK